MERPIMVQAARRMIRPIRTPAPETEIKVHRLDEDRETERQSMFQRCGGGRRIVRKRLPQE